MSTFVLVRAHLTTVQPHKDALFVEWSIAVAESETFGGVIVDGGDTFHSENHINTR
jgi:hypothetical protein